ncbi:MAG: 2-hydroxychromene-2-carboxylate isomerase [Candidatus Competibacteraceae bacterium]|nr:2-hydroxychromene-2-carboxylate isomerase [Candidatus Competibacteraceae bacterium]
MSTFQQDKPLQKIVFWYDLASTYSFLSAVRAEAVCKKFHIELVWRPFLLGPIFRSQGWDTSPFNLYEAKGRYMWRDLERRAAQLDLPPIVRPDPFPQNSLLAARVATIGVHDTWGPSFSRAVFTAQFTHGARIAESAVVVSLLDEVGVTGSEIVQRAQSDQVVKDALRQATEDAQRFGIFGAPSFTTEDGELFWGDDRLEDAISWARWRPRTIGDAQDLNHGEIGGNTKAG